METKEDKSTVKGEKSAEMTRIWGRVFTKHCCGIFSSNSNTLETGNNDYFRSEMRLATN